MNAITPPEADASTVHHSRVDAWLVVVLGFALLVCFGESVLMFRHGLWQGAIAVAVPLLIFALVAQFTWPCTYTLGASALEVRAGRLRQQIPYGDITAIAPSGSLWSAPALSLRRVRIDYGGRFVLVSPVDREAFIASLQARAHRARSATPPDRRA